jgi:hypothetical protein
LVFVQIGLQIIFSSSNRIMVLLGHVQRTVECRVRGLFFFAQNTLHAEETVLSSPRETTARACAPKTKSSARGPLYEFLQATD